MKKVELAVTVFEALSSGEERLSTCGIMDFEAGSSEETSFIKMIYLYLSHGKSVIITPNTSLSHTIHNTNGVVHISSRQHHSVHGSASSFSHAKIEDDGIAYSLKGGKKVDLIRNFVANDIYLVL